MNKIIISIIGIFVMAGLVYALATFTAAAGGLVGHWVLDAESYDSNTERITDKTPYENHGTNYGATLTTDQMGQSDRAMSFDGGSDYVSLPAASISAGNEISISFWAYVDVIQNNILMQFMEANGRIVYIHLLYGNGNTYWDCGVTEGGDFDRIYKLSPDIVGEWHHWVFWKNVATGYMKIYLDGEEWHSEGGKTKPITTPNAAGRLGVTFDGTISDVRIYNRALSVNEIDTLYQTYRRKASAGPLQKGLAGHWTLDAESYDSNTERITDKTPYENHGTNNGSILTTDQMGQSDRAMSFDGVNDYVNVPNTDMNYTSSFSYGAWFKADSFVSSWSGIISRMRAWPSGYNLQFGTTQNIACGWGTYTNSNDVAEVGRWYHAMCVYNGSAMRLYVDGILQDDIDTGTMGLSSTDFTMIGVFYTIPSLYFNGTISDVRIYNRALSDDEIDTLYHSYRPKASSGSLQKGLVLDMPLKSKYTKDETVGSEVMTDRTPYSNDGQNYGATVGSDYTSFDGSSDEYILTSNTVEIPQQYTLMTWIKGNLSDQISDNIYPFGWYSKVELSTSSGSSSSRGGILIRNSTDTGYHSIWDGTNVLDDKWHHWAATVDRTTGDVYIYLDGEQIHNDTIPNHYSGSHSIDIGSWASTYGHFTGLLSNARIYNRALSASEIKLLYDKGR